MRTVLFTSAVLFGVASADAAIVVTFVPRGTPIGSAGSPVATGYKGYTLRLTSTTGNITAVDLESGDRGLFGPMVQRWTSSAGDGTYDTPTVNVTGNNENLTNSVINFDSHLLQPGTPKADANYIGKINFGESLGSATFGPSGSQVSPFPTNSDAAGLAVSANDGYIKGAFGINGPAQSTTFDLAYVVFADNAPIVPFANPQLGYREVHGLVAVAGESPQKVIFWYVVPEPGLTALLGAGLVAGLRCRRRI
jgi:hypothetical protein